MDGPAATRDPMRQRPLWIWLMVGAATLFAGVFWISTLHQPLIDRHEFRQTQTALSALFMQPGVEGLLNYPTPVVGAPWSIPFEFPLYQWLTHQLAHHSGLALSASGRLLSVLFGVGCLWPASRLMRRAGLDGLAIKLFSVLYFTSSIYLYWNRAFLMESTALFLTLTSLDLYAQLRQLESASLKTLGVLSTAFAISLGLALVVKATTALPALALMVGSWLWPSGPKAHRPQRGLQQLMVAAAIAVAFAMLYSWTRHADALKQLNPIGAKLTSSALGAWNLGAFSQRLQPELWQKVVWQRMLTPVAALPIAALLAAAIWRGDKVLKAYLLASLFLAFAPLLIFTNLHIVHAYYQAGNQIYLLMAVAGSAAMLLDQNRQKPVQTSLVMAALTIMILGSLHDFTTNYWPRAQRSSSSKLVIGERIQQLTPTTSGILVFGDDWSSAFAYHSQRRAFTRPDWPGVGLHTNKVLREAHQHLGGLPLGAVVSREPIPEAALRVACQLREAHVIKSWNLYICAPVAPAVP